MVKQYGVFKQDTTSDNIMMISAYRSKTYAEEYMLSMQQELDRSLKTLSLYRYFISEVQIPEEVV